jgi:hypothetical protein
LVGEKVVSVVKGYMRPPYAPEAAQVQACELLALANGISVFQEPQVGGT